MRIVFVALLVALVLAHPHGSKGKGGSFGKGSHGKGGSWSRSHGKGPVQETREDYYDSKDGDEVDIDMGMPKGPDEVDTDMGMPKGPEVDIDMGMSGPGHEDRDRHHRPTALERCEVDVNRFCGHHDGPARRMACLEQHTAQLQPQCINALRPTVGFACATDVAHYCPETRGPGSAFDCLMNKQNEISDQCLAAIDRIDSGLSRQLGLTGVCANEAGSLCGSEATAVSMILCLNTNRASLSSSCQSQLEPLVSFNCVPDVPAICPRQQGRLGSIQCLKDHTSQLSSQCSMAVNPARPLRRSGEEREEGKEGKKHGRCGQRRQLFGLGLSAETWGYDEDRQWGWAHHLIRIGVSVGAFLVCCILSICCCRRFRKRRAARRALRAQQLLAAQSAPNGAPTVRIDNPALYPAQAIAPPTPTHSIVPLPAGSTPMGHVPVAAPVLVQSQPPTPTAAAGQVRYLVQAVPMPPPSPAHQQQQQQPAYAPLYPQFPVHPTQLRQPLLVGTIN